MKWKFPLTTAEDFCTRKEYLEHLRMEIKKFAETIGLEIKHLEIKLERKSSKEKPPK